MNCLIPRIPLELFLKIWGISIIFNAIGVGIKLISKTKEYKAKLRNAIGVDKETGITYLAEKKIRKLLEFDDKKHFIWLGIAIFLVLVLGIIYVIFLTIKPLSFQEWYEIFVSIWGWIAVLSILVPVTVSIKLYIYYVQVVSLSSKTSRK